MEKGIEQVVVDMGIVLFFNCKSNVAGCFVVFFFPKYKQLDWIGLWKKKWNKTVPM